GGARTSIFLLGVSEKLAVERVAAPPPFFALTRTPRLDMNRGDDDVPSPVRPPRAPARREPACRLHPGSRPAGALAAAAGATPIAAAATGSTPAGHRYPTAATSMGSAPGDRR